MHKIDKVDSNNHVHALVLTSSLSLMILVEVVNLATLELFQAQSYIAFKKLNSR